MISMMSNIKSVISRIASRFSLWLTWIILIAVFVFVVFWNHVVKVTPVGSVSVYWYRFPIARAITGDSRVNAIQRAALDSHPSASIIDKNSVGPLSEGAHFVWPWDEFYTYETRLRRETREYQVVSADGLHYEITLTFRWKVLDNNVVSLNQTIGEDYVERLMIPDVGAVARGVIARYPAAAMYMGKRQEIANTIYEYITDTRRSNGIGVQSDTGEDGNFISLKDILISNVKLPVSIREAIERKLQENQRVEEYKWRVERERLESERKVIEAEGIAKFQRIVAPQITESYLRWRGIEATLALSQSENSKVVVIGNSETGLPLILDTTTSDQRTVEPSDNSDSAAAATQESKSVRIKSESQIRAIHSEALTEAADTGMSSSTQTNQKTRTQWTMTEIGGSGDMDQDSAAPISRTAAEDEPKKN